jgi:hypothetical protein
VGPSSILGGVGGAGQKVVSRTLLQKTLSEVSVLSVIRGGMGGAMRARRIDVGRPWAIPWAHLRHAGVL